MPDAAPATIASRPCEQTRRDRRAARGWATGFRWLLALVVDVATSATASRSRPARCWSPRMTARPVPGRAGGAAAVAAAAGLRAVRRRARRPARPPADHRHRRPAARGRAGAADPRDRHRRGVDRAGAGRAVPARHRRGVRRQHLRDADADAGAPRRPRGRQRPADDRLHHRQPARRAADRRGAVRGRPRRAVRRPRRSWSRSARCWSSRIVLPPHGRGAATSAPTSATTSPRRSAGCCTTPPSAPWC